MSDDEMHDARASQCETVAIKVPPFWPEKPELWFIQLDAQFHIFNIKSENSKFYYLLSNLATKYLDDVAYIIKDTVQVAATGMENILTKICSVRPPLRTCIIKKGEEATCGFHLSRTQWDPYPWISNIETDSPAAVAGLTIGDFVIEVNDEDILGLKIDEVAKKVRLKNDVVQLLVWKSASSETENKQPPTFNLQKLSWFLLSTLQLLECPVCLDVSSYTTYQCVNGHLLCRNCCQKTSKCPMCRVNLSTRGRSLLADKLHRLIKRTLESGDVTNASSSPARTPHVPKTHICEASHLNCPWNEPCNATISSESAVFPHLYQCHSGPYTQYILRGHSLTVSVSGIRGIVYVATSNETIFFLRLLVTGECWLSVLGDSTKAGQFVFTASTADYKTDLKPLFVSSLCDTVTETLSRNKFFRLPTPIPNGLIKITLMLKTKGS